MSVLLLASLYFYSFNQISLFWLISGSILFNYGVSGKIITSSGYLRNAYAVFSIVSNLSLLFYFKYYGFFLENINGLFKEDLYVANIVLPIGISFYTFQQIAYCVDCYRGKVKNRDFLSYALFIAFFAQLIAGPIVHHGQVVKQYLSDNFAKFNINNLLIGVSIFGIGLFKKKVLADEFASYASPLFVKAAEGDSLSFIEAWQAAASYTFQIYFDFSGYSDMAIGLGVMLGLRLPVNFLSPYKSRSIIEFWRCWHITLSTFLKDYLYVPLGGNRKGQPRRWINLIITMLLGGLWHGANWTFFVWGGLHGVYLVINHMWRKFAPANKHLCRIISSSIYSYVAWLLTFLCVIIAWVFFRASNIDVALSILGSMVDIIGIKSSIESLSLTESSYYIYFAGAALIAFILPNTAEIFSDANATYEKITKRTEAVVSKLVFKPGPLWMSLLGAILGAAFFYQAKTTEFIYWQF